MRDIQLSRPVLLALLGAVLVGGYMFYSNTQNSGEVIPPTPAPSPATGQTGSTGKTGATGPTEKQDSAKEILKKRRAALRKKAAEAGIPLRVYMARRQGKEVVIFFWEPDAKDDIRVKQALDDLEKVRSKLVVFRDRISNKSDYDGIAEAAKITQTPGLVMVYRDKADSWQGYIDAGTLNERLTNLTGRSAKLPTSTKGGGGESIYSNSDSAN